MAKTLSFNEEAHEYRLVDEDGTFTIPVSVTEIAARVTGKDLSAVPAENLLAARARGNMIHKDVESRKFITPEGKWIAQQLDFTCFRSEVRGWAEIDGVSFCGTSDLVSEPDLEGIVEIDDIKSEAGEDRLYWTIQLALYRACFAPSAPVRHNVLAVPKTGNYTKIPIPALEQEKLAKVIAAYRAGKVLGPEFLDQVEVEAPEPVLDLVIYEQNLGQLTTNAKAILETVKRKCTEYKAENYNEENIAEAKRDRADLNAAAKKLNDERLRLEREFNKPFEEFKATITETCAEIKKASARIDDVVKSVEQREKEGKRGLIKAYFDDLKTSLITFDQIFDPAWLNKTAKLTEIPASIDDRLKTIQADLDILARVGEEEARVLYLTTYNLEGALKKADEIRENRERLAKIQADREAAKKAEAEKPTAEEKIEAARATAPVEVQEPAEEVTPPDPVPFPAPVILERIIRVRGTADDLRWLASAMKDRGMFFEKVAEGAA